MRRPRPAPARQGIYSATGIDADDEFVYGNSAGILIHLDFRTRTNSASKSTSSR